MLVFGEICPILSWAEKLVTALRRPVPIPASIWADHLLVAC